MSSTPTYVGSASSGTLEWQPGYTEEQMDDGTFTARAEARCRWDQRASLLPAIGSKPGPPGREFSQYVYLTKRTCIRLPAGLCKLMLYYQGASPSGNLPDSYGEFLAGQAEMPIQTHPLFDAFAGTPSTPVNNSKWNPDDGTFIKFSEYKNDGTLNVNWAGVMSYSSAQVTWRWHSFSTAGDFDLSKLDKIYNTPTGFSGTTPTDRDWLKVSHSSVQQGYVWHTTDDFLLSGPNGWNTTLYGTA